MQSGLPVDQRMTEFETMKPDTREIREAEVTRLMRLELAVLRAAIAARDKPTTKRLIDAMGDLLADDQIMGDLIFAALFASHETAGAHLAKLASDLIEVEAEEIAEAQVKAQEAETTLDPANCNPNSRLWDRLEVWP